MPDTTRPCPSCGARVPASADRCDLCGTAVEDGDSADSATDEGGDETHRAEEEGGGDERKESAEPKTSSAETDDEPSVFCNQCGWENPPGARYCSQCGEALQDLSSANSPTGTRPVAADLPTSPSSDASEADSDSGTPSPSEKTQKAMGQQIALLVGGALVLVVGLFFATQWSAQYEWGGEQGADASAASAGNEASSTGSVGESPPRQSGGASGGGELTDLQTLLDQAGTSSTGAMAGQIDSLETEIEQASGADKRAAQAELVNLLIGVGQPGRAAVLQKDIAAATGAVDAERRAADLLYRWMQQLQGEGQRQQVLDVARHAGRAYEAVVDQRPDDLDARTRMGEAFLLTNRPMRGIKAINAVLDEDSTFVPARFQKGLALLQINRLDQATKEFEQVKRFSEEGSPFVRQAEQALKIIEKQRQRSSSEAPSQGGPGSGGAGAPQ
ncbi:MAG: zinc ribbon domain-containing protein [Salinibacter sp.]|uniref:zinc ribbon domain-containing protein n=1 Tax=Salinibacter sp. TaxID=2065818 RepID=UPI002FC2A823